MSEPVTVAPEATSTPKAEKKNMNKPAGSPLLKYVPRVLGLILTLILAQHASDAEWTDGVMIGLSMALIIGAVMVWLSGRKLYEAICSIPFAVVLLLTIAVATALGTFVPQAASSAQLQEHFAKVAIKVFGQGSEETGFWLADWAERLILDDVFHSLWFSGLLALLSLSLLLVVLRRPFWRVKQWGFVLTHGGMVAVIAGGGIGGAFGVRGMLSVPEGSTKDRFELTGRDEGLSANLPFKVRLDKFDLEVYPDYMRFVVFKTGPEETLPLQSIKLERANEWVPVRGTDQRFRVREFRESGAGQDVAPKHLLFAESEAEPMVVEVGQTYKVPNSDQSFKVTAFYNHFSFNMETRRPENASAEPKNPALEVEAVSSEAGVPAKKQWLFAKHAGHGSTLPLKYQYRVPASGPCAIVEIARKGSEQIREVSLSTSGSDSSVELARKELKGAAPQPENPHAHGGNIERTVLLFEKKHGEPKSYRSNISVLEDDQVVKQATIEVNQPLSHRGYALYQAKYDNSRGMTVTGLSVVHDPGLGLAYVGMVMICLGVIFIFYVRARL